jgi:hypothetical protein
MVKEHLMMDYSWITSPEVGLSRVEANCTAKYVELSCKYPLVTGWTKEQYLFRFFITRLSAVHTAASREIKQSNPHAVFPLLRVYFETLSVLIYCTERPSYISALVLEEDRNNPILKIDQILTNLENLSGTLKLIYHELSSYSHPQGEAVGKSFMDTRDLGEGQIVQDWIFEPHWIAMDDFKGACGATVEMSETAFAYLDLYGMLFLTKS